MQHGAVTKDNIMANRTQRTPENAAGQYYVDDSCIDCDMCRTIAPEFFSRFDEGGYSIAHRQPVIPEEFAQAEAGLNSCPTDSIGNDGDAAP